jgi:hypothetical protein
MRKCSYFFGQTTIGQVFKLIPNHIIARCVIKHQSNKSIKKFDSKSHLAMLCYAVLANVQGLRQVCDGMMGMGSKLNHMGISFIAPKSTLADANNRRRHEFFGSVYKELLQYYGHILSDKSIAEPLLKKAFAIDSTTISLFKAILKASGRKPKDGKERGGIKSNMQIRLIDEMPMNVTFSAGADNDHEFLPDLVLEKDDIAIFDKAYNDYAQFQKWTGEEIWFVTREKTNAKSKIILERDLPEDKDYEILLDDESEYSYKDKAGEVQRPVFRRVTVYSEEHEEKMVLLTNILHLEASQISMLYQRRWRIELLFKQLKQNFPLKYFFGETENAIKTQIWVSLIVNLLLTVVHLKAKNKKQSFRAVVSLIRQHLYHYINIIKFLADPKGLALEYMKTSKRKLDPYYQTEMKFNSS